MEKDRAGCIRLNPKIYDRKCIERSMHDFSAVCTITEKDGRLCFATKDGTDTERIANEFCNYVLAMMKDSKA
jgi:hypothetical protein